VQRQKERITQASTQLKIKRERARAHAHVQGHVAERDRERERDETESTGKHATVELNSSSYGLPGGPKYPMGQ